MVGGHASLATQTLCSCDMYVQSVYANMQVRFAGAPAVAIEVVRGLHLTALQPFQQTSPAVWRTWQLRARGLHVVELDGDAWRQMTEETRAAHLRSLLAGPGRLAPVAAAPAQ